MRPLRTFLAAACRIDEEDSHARSSPECSWNRDPEKINAVDDFEIYEIGLENLRQAPIRTFM